MQKHRGNCLAKLLNAKTKTAPGKPDAVEKLADARSD
jgi:hypothetical protein